MKISKEELKACLVKGMTDEEIAKQYSMSKETVATRRRKLARSGFSPTHDMMHETPEGFMLKGTSTLYKNGAPVLQWVKTKIDPEVQEELIRQFLQGALDEIPRVPPVVSPVDTDENLVNLYIMTDYHLGMLAWRGETGDDWDMSIAEELALKWMRAAIDRAPNAHTAILGQLGDFMHWDGLDAVTPSSGHVLDADTRFTKLARTALKLMKAMIQMLLEKHEHVHIVCAEGNHDMASSVWMREVLWLLYEDEPRVTVDRSADPYYCYVYGDVSLFFHHGHKKKPTAISETFAGKFRKQWGSTEYSYAHMGHFHHQMALESSLMIVEQHRTLAAKDAYASRGGWLSGRSSPVITYHAKYGEVSRLTISPEMVS